MGFCWWNESWENDDVPANNSDLFILHDRAPERGVSQRFAEAQESHSGDAACAEQPLGRSAFANSCERPMMTDGSGFD
jgi:hypothetical protein